jgi:DNA-binding transcriptional ArsR family regulator
MRPYKARSDKGERVLRALQDGGMLTVALVAEQTGLSLKAAGTWLRFLRRQGKVRVDGGWPYEWTLEVSSREDRAAMARYTVGDTTGDRILKHLGRYGGLSASQVAEDLSISPSSARGWLAGLLAQGKVTRSGWPYKWTVVRGPVPVAAHLPNGVYKSSSGTRWVLVGYGGDPGQEYAVLHQLMDYAKGQVIARYPSLEIFRSEVAAGAWVFVGPRP